MPASAPTIALRPSHPGRLPAWITLLLAGWFALVVLLGASGAFISAPGAPPFGLLLGVALPILVFLCSYWCSASLRQFVLAADLQLLTTIQACRFAGFSFIALYAQGILPGYFAWPAGLGDIAIGLTAPWIAGALRHDSRFKSSRPFVTWNLLGILDLLVALSMGAIASLFLSRRAPGDADHLVTTAPMTHLPLVLVPTFFVPIFLLLHLAALGQAGSLTKGAR